MILRSGTIPESDFVQKVHNSYYRDLYIVSRKDRFGNKKCSRIPRRSCSVLSHILEITVILRAVGFLKFCFRHSGPSHSSFVSHWNLQKHYQYFYHPIQFFKFLTFCDLFSSSHWVFLWPSLTILARYCSFYHLPLLSRLIAHHSFFWFRFTRLRVLIWQLSQMWFRSKAASLIRK